MARRALKGKIARYILIINSFLMVLYGVAVIVQPNLFTGNLEIYTGMNMDELNVTYEKLAEYIGYSYHTQWGPKHHYWGHRHYHHI